MHDPSETEARAVAYLNRMPASIEGSGGSAALMAAARVVVWGFAFGPEVGAEILCDHFNPRCEPPWTIQEIRHKCDDAATGGDRPRGWLLEAEPANSPSLANRPAAGGSNSKNYAAGVLDFPAPRPAPAPSHEIATRRETATMIEPTATAKESTASGPTAGSVGQGGLCSESVIAPLGSVIAPLGSVIAPLGSITPIPHNHPEPEFPAGTEDDDPSRLARLFLHQFRYSGESCYTLVNKGEDWFIWQEGSYREISNATVTSRLANFIDAEFERLHSLAGEAVAALLERGDTQAAKKAGKRHRLTRGIVLDTLMMVRAWTLIDTNLESFFIDDPKTETTSIVSFTNGILNLRDLLNAATPEEQRAAFYPATPRFFTRNSLTYAYTPDAPPPRRWMAFLNSIWPDDRDSQDLLQEWFGYLLSGETYLQKIAMIVGAKRGGKGTIREIITRLLGANNVAALGLGDMVGDHAMHSLVGKSAIVFPDARIDGRDEVTRITERLLSISGEDPQLINPKYKATYSIKLGGRLIIFSNRVPEFRDSSGAIVSRLSMLRLHVSFIGREDHTLLEKLTAELPSIFLWGLQGYQRLTENRRFTQPESAAELIEAAEGMASPIMSFVAECCEFEEGRFETTSELFATWQGWCERQNIKAVGSSSQFSAALASAYPQIKRARPGTGSDRKPGFSGMRILTTYERGDIPL
jgi:putative DNA primase/helicase